eukprot:TRINITY_DN39086_c0_g1_i1.p1 TRINITY_DN39086_c0_g1~~TRINITY_DN39086_c0_g1_i1.p1  ORF type:complete len:432 (+),score=70.45 TRINITY_DN39086_c0_g1_i1:235-1530(+)
MRAHGLPAKLISFSRRSAVYSAQTFQAAEKYSLSVPDSLASASLPFSKKSVPAIHNPVHSEEAKRLFWTSSLSGIKFSERRSSSPPAIYCVGKISTACVSFQAMKAIDITSPGGPEVLKLTDVAEPVLKAGEVIIAVAATALNKADTMQRQGNYPPPPGASTILGLECSGVIEAVGEGVEGWKVGDKVCALLAGGGYAEKVAVPASQLFPIPANVSLLEAAALPEVSATVWSTVFMTCGLKSGDTFLVHGGSSGIGTMAIQLAKAKGVRVFCTAGSDEKLTRCKQLGADVAINYKTEDFVARAKEESGGKGVDVILDNMGGSYLGKNLKALAPDGRLFIIGLQGGRVGEVDLGAMLVKRLTIASAGLRGRPLAEKAKIVAEVAANVWPEVEAGKVKPIIHAVFPLAQAAEAHAIMDSSAHIGKVLLQVADV